MLILISLFLEILPSSVFMNCEVSIELMINATNSDDPRTIERVIGNITMNLPMVPGHKPSGKKAIKVVAVEAIIGHAISPRPCLAAFVRGQPSSIRV